MEQRTRLEMEGVRFRGKRVDMAEHQHRFRPWDFEYFFGLDGGKSGMDSGTAATNGTTATGGRRSGFNARGFTAGDPSGTASGRRLRRMMGNNPFMV